MIKKGKQFIFIILIAIVAGVAYVYWNKTASKTKIALVNFQQFQTTAIVRANQDNNIVYNEVPTDKLNKLNKYDFVLAFGMGLNITEEQREQLHKLADKGFPVYVYSPTSPENDICNLDSLERVTISDYLSNGNKKNYQSLARYIRVHIDKKTYFVNHPDTVTESASDVLYHLDEEVSFSKVEDYEHYLKEKGFYKPNAPKVAIIGGMNDPFSGNKDNTDSLIVSLQRSGLNVYPVSSFMKRLNFLKDIQPDAVIHFAHGRMIMGQPDSAVEWLKERNIPVFAPLSSLQTKEEWMNDPMGMIGGFMSQSIVVPELDGSIYPYMLTVQEVDKDGLYLFKTVPERLADFTQIIHNFISLRQKDNADKKLAIYYFKGAGQSSLTAQGLETVPSLYNFLKYLKNAGYKVDGLPSDLKDFEKMLMTQGAVLSTYAEGAFDEFLKNGNPDLIEKSTYESWIEKSIPAEIYKDVTNLYGEAPGKYMSVQQDGKSYLAVARIQLGNIALLPQPMAALGDDEFAIVHGAKTAPPHTYIASYLWMQHQFKADAMLHFGAHGSLEFTPQKQVALSSNDWPDRLVGHVPHFYYYTIANIGESMMAKRRSYASVVSYLTPPFMETETRSQFRILTDKIENYYKTDESLHDKASLEVKKIAVEMGLHRDLRLDSVLTNPYTYEDIERIENFAEEIASEKMTGQLYTSGVAYSKDKIRSTVLAISADPVAYSLAEIDKQRGKTDAEQLKNKSFFNEKYLKPAQSLVNRVLDGMPVNETVICSVAGITAEELAEAKTILAPKRRMAMPEVVESTGRSSKSDAKDKKSGGGGHPAWIPKFGKKPEHSEKSEDKKVEENSGEAPPHAMHGGQMPDTGAIKGHPGGHPHNDMMNKSENHQPQNGHPHGGMGGKMPAKGEGKEMPGRHPGSNQETKSSEREYTSEEKSRARAITEVERTINNITKYKEALETSPEEEFRSMVNALNGGYVAPSSGGDVVANPNAVPTGRNLYAVNAESTPSEVAWNKGVSLVNATLQQYKKQHGEYPRKVSYTFWSSEFIETEGATIAQVLYMLGVEPVRNSYGRVADIQLIPSQTLGRPRIDVVVQTSGQFRDLAASRLSLITRAVEMASSAKDDIFENYVSGGTVGTEKMLVEQGVSPKDAREMSVQRIFGGLNGMYGSGIQEMVTKGDRWENEQEIADTYIHNMGAVYGSDEDWGKYQEGLLRAVLHNTDVVIHPRQSNTWGALSLDHVYEFMGGMNLAVRNVTGKDPEAYFADYRNRNHVKMQELKESIGIEARSTIFNPTYIREMMKGNASSASQITEVVTNTYGWNVMKPDVVDKEMWDRIYTVYVKDEFNLGTESFFRSENPYALQEITAVMLETARKGMWEASEQQLSDIAELHTELVKEFGASGTGFAGENSKLQDFIAQKVNAQSANEYKQQIDKMRTSGKTETVENGMVLSKQEVLQMSDSEESNINGILIASVVLIIFVVLLIVLKRKRR